MTRTALLAVLTVVASHEGLERTLTSLVAQTDPEWQWCIAVAGDSPEGTLEAVKWVVSGESRAVVVPGSDRHAELAALAFTLADAGNVTWVDAGDSLDPSTFAVVRERLKDAPWVYTDEAAVESDGSIVQLWFKPDFAPERLRSQPYAIRLAVLPLDLARELGGIRAEAGSAAWYDLVLRIAAKVGPADHVAGPYYLHGSPGAGVPFIADDPLDRCRVVALSMEDAGEQVDVSPIEVDGRPIGQRVRRHLQRTPRISLVIPTRASSSRVHGFPRCHVVEFVRSLWTADRYDDIEVIIVCDTGTPDAALAEITAITGGAAVLLPFFGPFHFSRKCNAGALAATGEYLIFLNDDMEIATPDWLHEMASLLADPGVGAVGGRLLFADGTLQHAGHEYDGGNAGHTMFRYAGDDHSSGGAALITSERSGVTGACFLVRAGDFLQVGGFSEEFPLSYNDVDLSLKIRARGLRILYTPHATLLHYESQTREPTVTDTEVTRIRRRWLSQLQSDPYVNELLRSPSGPRASNFE